MRVAVAIMVALLAGKMSLAGEDPAAGKLKPRNEATFREILAAASDPDRDVRSRVAWIIGRTERQDGLPALKRLAHDPVPDVRAAALRALCRILPRGETITVALRVPVEDSHLHYAALVAAAHLFFEQRDALIKAELQSGAISGKTAAVRALGLGPADKSRPAILDALKDGHALIRAAAVGALAEAKDREAVALVLAALGEDASADSFVVRAAACAALARMATQDGRRELHAAMSDKHFLVRREAINALAALKDRTALPLIRKRTTDADFTVREAACAALGVMIDPASPPPLADRLADEVVEVRAAAEKALAGFPPDMAYKSLIKYVDYRERVDTRQRVWRLLGLYGHPATREIALAHLADSDTMVGVYALRIGRKLADRRVIPHVINLLHTRMVGGGRGGRAIEAGPDEFQGEEGFRAAILFKLTEPVPFAMLCVRRAINPPLMGDFYIASDPIAAWATRYLTAVDHRPVVPILEAAMENKRLQRRPNLLGAFAAALKQMTGRHYTLPPQTVAEVWSPLFIEVVGE